MNNSTNFPALLDETELAAILECDDLDELRELHDRLSDQRAAVTKRIWELEERRGHDERRAERSARPIVL